MTYHSYIPEINTGEFADWKRQFRAAWSDLPAFHDNCEERWYSEAAFKIAGEGKAGLNFLISQLDDRDDLRLREILSALSQPRIRLRKIHQILKRYIKDRRPLIAAEAVDSAKRLEYEDLLSDVLRRRNDPSPYVVGGVLRYLSRLYPKRAMPLLTNALSSNDPIVVQNGIDELEDLGAVQALAKIQELRHHPHIHVRQAAGAAAENLWRILHDF